MELAQFGKVLVLIGILIILVGLFLIFAGKIPFFGKFPGDIVISGKNFKFYFPIVTFLIISLILTIIFNVFFRK